MNITFVLNDGTIHRIPGVTRIDAETHDGFTVIVNDHPRDAYSNVSVGAGIVHSQRIGGETSAVFALLDNAARLANSISQATDDLALGDHFAYPDPVQS